MSATAKSGSSSPRDRRRSPPGIPELVTAKDAKNLAIGAFGPDVELVNFGVSAYSDEKIGFLASHQRLVITAKRNNVNDNEISLLTMSFFVKAFPYEVSTQAEYVKEKGVFDQETAFFRDVAPELLNGFKSEPWMPECRIIKKDCLVFEDLGYRGFSMSDHFLDEEEVKAGLGAIARLHAASLYAETRLGRPLVDINPGAFQERAFVQSGNQHRWYLAGVDVAVKIAEDLGLDASRIPEACEKVFEAMKASRSKRNVASHGDLWSNNLMFDDSRQPPRCRLVDFQLARYAPLGHDVAQFLHLCCSRTFRDSRAEEMLRFYYEALGECLLRNSAIFVKIPSWRELRLGYEEQTLAAVVTAVMYFPTVLLDGQLGARIMNDPESYRNFVLRDRRDVVVENMRRDQRYRRRIEETVRQLVQLASRLEELPKPC